MDWAKQGHGEAEIGKAGVGHGHDKAGEHGAQHQGRGGAIVMAALLQAKAQNSLREADNDDGEWHRGAMDHAEKRKWCGHEASGQQQMGIGGQRPAAQDFGLPGRRCGGRGRLFSHGKREQTAHYSDSLRA